eukprot:114382-Pyramimonas_sp.AAC.1
MPRPPPSCIMTDGGGGGDRSRVHRYRPAITGGAVALTPLRGPIALPISREGCRNRWPPPGWYGRQSPQLWLA